MEYPGVWFLDARPDAEGLEAPRFCDLPENRPILGDRGAVFGTGTPHCAVPQSSPGRHCVHGRNALHCHALRSGEYNGSC
jgi:hypothetical protein